MAWDDPVKTEESMDDTVEGIPSPTMSSSGMEGISSPSTSSGMEGIYSESDSNNDVTRSTRRSSRIIARMDSEASSDAYNLRTSSLVSRVVSETKRRTPRKPKPKTRPPPLSKYRRRTANSRERDRMQDMNEAYDDLRRVIPNFPIAPASKPTKITTLRLALNYIQALREVLGYQGEEDKPYPTGSFSSDVISTSDSMGDVTSSDSTYEATDTLDGVSDLRHAVGDTSDNRHAMGEGIRHEPSDCTSGLQLEPDCTSHNQSRPLNLTSDIELGSLDNSRGIRPSECISDIEIEPSDCPSDVQLLSSDSMSDTENGPLDGRSNIRHEMSDCGSDIHLGSPDSPPTPSVDPHLPEIQDLSSDCPPTPSVDPLLPDIQDLSSDCPSSTSDDPLLPDIQDLSIDLTMGTSLGVFTAQPIGTLDTEFDPFAFTSADTIPSWSLNQHTCSVLAQRYRRWPIVKPTLDHNQQR